MIHQEDNIKDLLNKIKKARMLNNNIDDDNSTKSKRRPCLSQEYLFAKEYQKVTKSHKSMLYKQMDADERYEYDCMLEDEIMLIRDEYRRMRMPPLSNEELETYLGPYGG